MKVNDLVAGLVFLVVAGLFAAGAWNLPNPSQQPLGPSAFPLILAGFLVLCATLLAWQGARAPERGPVLALAGWARNPIALARLLLVPAAVLFYVMASEALGFLVAAALILAALFLAGGVRPRLALPLSLAAALAMHSIFYLGLGVQLPWGLLEPVRW